MNKEIIGLHDGLQNHMAAVDDFAHLWVWGKAGLGTNSSWFCTEPRSLCSEAEVLEGVRVSRLACGAMSTVLVVAPGEQEEDAAAEPGTDVCSERSVLLDVKPGEQVIAGNPLTIKVTFCRLATCILYNTAWLILHTNCAFSSS